MPQSRIDPEALLAGPRGRRLCWTLVDELRLWLQAHVPESAGPGYLAAEVAAVIARDDVDAIARTQDPVAFLEVLCESMSWAWYWQEPEDWDRRLADRRVSETLRPVAEALGSAAAAQWWTTPMEPATQFEVRFEDPKRPTPPPERLDADSGLVQWRGDALALERRAESFPDDPTARYSGRWWSTPALSGLLHSTRAFGSAGPVGLALGEDFLGWTSALCRAVTPPSDASIFEIRGPDDWVELVERYPFAVPRSRRHDWWRATGLDTHWVIPDYLAAAADYDGIHLTVQGYLSTAGRALPVGNSDTLLAGWDPDATWWLTARTNPTGPAVRWLCEDRSSPSRWTREI